MRPLAHLAAAAVVGLATTLGIGDGLSAAPPAPQPITLPCATNASAQVLGTGSPPAAAGETLVLARVILGPSGGIGPHRHPGTLVVSVESGTPGLTLLEDAEMAVMRASLAGTPAAAETVSVGQEVELPAGDWWIEGGMVHQARSVGDEPTVVLLSGLIEAGQPLTARVEETAGT